MKKHFTRRKRFYPRSLDPGRPNTSSNDSTLELSFLNEIACFETLRSYQGRLFCFRRHGERLLESCRSLQKNCPLKLEELRRWVAETLRDSGFKDALIRLSVHWNSDECCDLVVIIRPFTRYPAQIYRKGVSLKTAVPRRLTLKAQDPQIKATQFMNGVLAKIDHQGPETRELMFLNADGFVAEGSVSNIFIVKEKRLLTPKVASGILRGVTRDIVLEIARKKRIETCETFLTRHEFYCADECFITNTSSEILPVVTIDERSVGEGRPGPITRDLAKELFHKKSQWFE